MTQTQTPITGGRFLTTTLESDDLFILEELTEEQQLVGRTAAEFMQREVLPVVDQLYKHDWELTRRLMKKASELDLLRLEIPPAYGGLGLDLISAAYVGEQIAIDPSFGGSLGAHTSIGTLPLVYFGTQEQKQRYLPLLARRELIGAFAFNVLNFGSVKLGARNMSGVKLALDRSVKYAKERRQFGRPIAEFGLIKEKLAGMAVRAFVGDAMSYRALGDVDRAVESAGRNDGARVMRTIEGFAVECSINKIWTSEALGWAVDQAVQLFGGNGYSREFPVERMYRDARITRIYEGTNEINRLLIPARLQKQSPALFNVEAARDALADRPSPLPRGPLAAERDFVVRAKRVAVALLGLATDSYGDDWKEAQGVHALRA